MSDYRDKIKIPESPDEVVELAKWAKSRWVDDEAPGIFASYLVSECGANPFVLIGVLHPVWPEAANAVHIPERAMTEQCARKLIMGFNHRLGVVHSETLRSLGERKAAELLEEWDALNFPEQMPEAIRTRALKRNRRALALFPHRVDA